MNTIYYEVTYTPASGIKISDIMSKLDLGIETITTTEAMSWTTSTKITDKYIKKMCEVLKKAVENSGGKVYEVKYLYHRNKLK